jgi:hypothetical protein
MIFFQDRVMNDALYLLGSALNESSVHNRHARKIPGSFLSPPLAAEPAQSDSTAQEIQRHVPGCQEHRQKGIHASVFEQFYIVAYRFLIFLSEFRGRRAHG